MATIFFEADFNGVKALNKFQSFINSANSLLSKIKIPNTQQQPTLSSQLNNSIGTSNISTANASVNTLTANLNKANSSGRNLTNTLSAINRIKFSSIAEGIVALGTAISQITAPLANISSESLEFGKALETQRIRLAEYSGSVANSIKVTEDFRRALGNIPISEVDATKSLANLTDALNPYGKGIEESSIILSGFTKSVAKAGGSQEDLREVLNQVNQIIRKNKIEVQEDLIPIFQRTSGITAALFKEFGTADLTSLQRSGTSALDIVIRLSNELNNLKVPETPALRLARLDAKIKDLKANFGVALLPVLDKFVDLLNTKILPLVDFLVKKFESLSDTSKTIVSVFGAIGLALGPVISFIGLFGNGISALIGLLGTEGLLGFIVGKGVATGAATGTFSAIIAGLGALSIALAKIIVIATLIAAAIGTIYLAYKNNFAGIQDRFTQSINSIKTIFNDLTGFISNWWERNGNNSIKALQVIYQKIVSLLRIVEPYIKDIVDLLFEVSEILRNSVLSTIANVIKDFLDLLEAVINFINGDTTKAVEKWNVFFESSGKRWIKVFDTILFYVNNFWLKLQSILLRLTEFVLNKIVDAIEAIPSILVFILNTEQQRIANFISFVIDKFSTLPDVIGNALLKLFQILKDLFFRLINFTANFFSDPLNIKMILDVYNNLGKILGNGLISSIINELKNGFPTVRNWIRQLAKAAGDAGRQAEKEYQSRELQEDIKSSDSTFVEGSQVDTPIPGQEPKSIVNNNLVNQKALPDKDSFDNSNIINVKEFRSKIISLGLQESFSLLEIILKQELGKVDGVGAESLRQAVSSAESKKLLDINSKLKNLELQKEKLAEDDYNRQKVSLESQALASKIAFTRIDAIVDLIKVYKDLEIENKKLVENGIKEITKVKESKENEATKNAASNIILDNVRNATRKNLNDANDKVSSILLEMNNNVNELTEEKLNNAREFANQLEKIIDSKDILTIELSRKLIEESRAKTQRNIKNVESLRNANILSPEAADEKIALLQRNEFQDRQLELELEIDIKKKDLAKETSSIKQDILKTEIRLLQLKQNEIAQEELTFNTERKKLLEEQKIKLEREKLAQLKDENDKARRELEESERNQSISGQRLKDARKIIDLQDIYIERKTLELDLNELLKTQSKEMTDIEKERFEIEKQRIELKLKELEDKEKEVNNPSDVSEGPSLTDIFSIDNLEESSSVLETYLDNLVAKIRQKAQEAQEAGRAWQSVFRGIGASAISMAGTAIGALKNQLAVFIQTGKFSVKALRAEVAEKLKIRGREMAIEAAWHALRAIYYAFIGNPAKAAAHGLQAAGLAALAAITYGAGKIVGIGTGGSSKDNTSSNATQQEQSNANAGILTNEAKKPIEKDIIVNTIINQELRREDGILINTVVKGTSQGGALTKATLNNQSGFLVPSIP